MASRTDQPGLFDSSPLHAPAETEAARARMRGMIDAIANTDIPPWKDQVGVIMDDGSFQRAMRLVPDAEAQALWDEFDPHMERLYAIWAATQEQP